MSASVCTVSASMALLPVRKYTMAFKTRMRLLPVIAMSTVRLESASAFLCCCDATAGAVGGVGGVSP